MMRSKGKKQNVLTFTNLSISKHHKESDTEIELQDNHVTLEEKRCGDYFACDK